MKTVAILAAAGRGERLGGKKAKLWAEVAGKPLIYHSIACIEKALVVDGIIVMAPADDLSALRKAIKGWGFKKVIKTLAGGERRQDTVRIGLKALPRGGCEIVVIHDAARPMASPALFKRVVEAARRAGAATSAIEPVDTIVQMKKNGDPAMAGLRVPIFPQYLDRSQLRQIQTPQAFKTEIIIEAHQHAQKDRFTGTDDASLVIRNGHPVELVPGEAGNFKVTYTEDIAQLENLLK